MNKTFHTTIPQNYFMSWFITTQAANKISVKLWDNTKTYVNACKQSTNIDPPLACGYAKVGGNNLSLTVDVPNACNLLGTPHSNDIITDDGKVVGKEYTLCLEDSTDNDYNDIAISIVAWKNKG